MIPHTLAYNVFNGEHTSPHAKFKNYIRVSTYKVGGTKKILYIEEGLYIANRNMRYGGYHKKTLNNWRGCFIFVHLHVNINNVIMEREIIKYLWKIIDDIDTVSSWKFPVVTVDYDGYDVWEGFEKGLVEALGMI